MDGKQFYTIYLDWLEVLDRGVISSYDLIKFIERNNYPVELKNININFNLESLFKQIENQIEIDCYYFTKGEGKLND